MYAEVISKVRTDKMTENSKIKVKGWHRISASARDGTMELFQDRKGYDMIKLTSYYDYSFATSTTSNFRPAVREDMQATSMQTFPDQPSFKGGRILCWGQHD